MEQYMTPQEFLKHIGWHKGTIAKFSYNELVDTLKLYVEKVTPAPQDVPVGLEQYAPTKEELLIANTKAVDHEKRWGGPADSYASYLTGFAHGIGYGREQELKRVQEAQAGVWVKASTIDVSDWYLGRVIGTEKKFPVRLAANLACDAAGKTYLKADLEVLSESPSLPAKEQAVDPVAYSEWADLHAVRNGRHNWTVGTGNDKKHFTSDELLVFYTQSLQNKQP